MAQSTPLALGTTAATSTDLVLAAGAYGRIGIFSDARLPSGAQATVLIDTPGIDNVYAYLDGAQPQVTVVGPCTLRVFRPACGTAIGVFAEA